MRKQIRSKEAQELLQQYFFPIDKKDRVELADDALAGGTILFFNERPCFFLYQNSWVPTLRYLLQRSALKEHPLLKKATVDMGAIKFIIDGADIMRPGIVSIEEEIKKDDFVVIVDQTHGKPIAIGRALFSAEEIELMERGKVIKNIHYVGDEVWKVD